MSLLCRLKNLVHKGILKEKDLERIVIILKGQEPCDCISRKTVNTLIDELARAISDERCCISRGRDTATIMQEILDLPSIQPKTDVLDKIRAEIEQEYLAEGHLSDYWDGIDKCLEIIDKYKAESEDKE